MRFFLYPNKDRQMGPATRILSELLRQSALASNNG